VAVTVAQSRIGRGVFAARLFDAGETIVRVEGRVVHHSVLWKRRGSEFSANCLRFGPHTYLDPGTNAGRWLNHSCEPNAGLRKAHGRLYLFAVRRIAAGTEIVFDYSTTIGDDDIWTMRCRCGRARCRGTIRNFGSLPARVRDRYVDRGMVPEFILGLSA
jgi:SET domain-containing protein